jgi:asparagine synthase (glutamine-hydrolysing)
LEPALFLRLDAAFERSLAEALRGGDPVTVLYSGGVDSSLVAHGIAAHIAPRLRSVGVAGASDLRDGESGAALLRLRWEGTVVGSDDVIRAVRRHGLAVRPEPGRSVLASLAVALGQCGPGRVLVGQGADELFGGYAHFRGLSPADLEQRRILDYRRLTDDDWPATLAIADRLGCDLRAPFLDPAFVREALAVRLTPVAPGELTKPTLRAWAVHRGVPTELAQRPKRAMQFGSGVARLVRGAGSS